MPNLFAGVNKQKAVPLIMSLLAEQQANEPQPRPPTPQEVEQVKAKAAEVLSQEQVRDQLVAKPQTPPPSQQQPPPMGPQQPPVSEQDFRRQSFAASQPAQQQQPSLAGGEDFVKRRGQASAAAKESVMAFLDQANPEHYGPGVIQQLKSGVFQNQPEKYGEYLEKALGERGISPSPEHLRPVRNAVAEYKKLLASPEEAGLQSGLAKQDIPGLQKLVEQRQLATKDLPFAASRKHREEMEASGTTSEALTKDAEDRLKEKMRLLGGAPKEEPPPTGEPPPAGGAPDDTAKKAADELAQGVTNPDQADQRLRMEFKDDPYLEDAIRDAKETYARLQTPAKKPNVAEYIAIVLMALAGANPVAAREIFTGERQRKEDERLAGDKLFRLQTAKIGQRQRNRELDRQMDLMQQRGDSGSMKQDMDRIKIALQNRRSEMNNISRELQMLPAGDKRANGLLKRKSDLEGEVRFYEQMLGLPDPNAPKQDARTGYVSPQVNRLLNIGGAGV